MRRTIKAQLMAFGIFVESVLAANPPTSGPFKGCLTEGKGGDTVLNELKNRSASSDRAIKTSISAIVNFADPGVTNRLPRDKWTNGQLSK
jgi:hypothetical protein